jgi:hypothetical protein
MDLARPIAIEPLCTIPPYCEIANLSPCGHSAAMEHMIVRVNRLRPPSHQRAWEALVTARSRAACCGRPRARIRLTVRFRAPASAARQELLLMARTEALRFLDVA